MTQENPNFFSRKVSRRKALALLGGGSVAAVYTAYKIKNDTVPRFFPSTPEARDISSNQVEAGVVAIYEGVNIRTSPVIPDETRFRQPDNRIDWGQINTVNGIELNGRSAFVVVNPSVVAGQNVHDGTRDGFDWIKVDIQKKGEADAKPHYINHSTSTSDHVKGLGYAGYIATEGEYSGLGIVKFGKEFLESEDIDQIIVPENLESIAGDIMPKLWSERMRKQFEMCVVPEMGKMVEGVQVVDFWGENTPVNVREYPSQQYGNGERVKVAGTLAPGTRIDKVLIPPDDYYHYDYSAVLSEDINGFLIDDRGNSVVLSPGNVYAIATPYLSKV